MSHNSERSHWPAPSHRACNGQESRWPHLMLKIMLSTLFTGWCWTNVKAKFHNNKPKELWGLGNLGICKQEHVQLPKLTSGLCKKMEKKILYVQMHYRAQIRTDIVLLLAGYRALRISADNRISLFWCAQMGLRLTTRLWKLPLIIGHRIIGHSLNLIISWPIIGHFLYLRSEIMDSSPKFLNTYLGLTNSVPH